MYGRLGLNSLQTTARHGTEGRRGFDCSPGRGKLDGENEHVERHDL